MKLVHAPELLLAALRSVMQVFMTEPFLWAPM